MTWFLVLAGLSIAALGGWIYLTQRDYHARLDDIERTITAIAARLPALEDPERVVAEPPSVGGDTIRDWLLYHTLGRYRWSDAVAEFYARAAADPQIAAYFYGVDMERLQRHFTRAMITLTQDGLKQGKLTSLAKIHAQVQTPDGAPITHEVYDKVITVLVGILQEWGVPDDAIRELAGVIEPLRGAIVAPDPIDQSA
jgi:hemoglobin